MKRTCLRAIPGVLLASALSLAVQSAAAQQPANRKDEPLAMPASTVTGQGPASPQGPDQGYRAERSAAASKTGTPLAETPRSVSVVTRQRMVDQQSQTLTDVLGYVPGIFAPPFAAGDGLAGDYFFIRGYNATDFGYGLYRDGLRVQGNRYDTSSEPYGLERVEVFRGPTSILYGENAPGGLVNLVSKRPTEQSRGEVQASYGSHDRRQLGVDVSGPLNEAGNLLGRVVLLGREANTQVDHVPDDRLYLAPSLTLAFSEDTRLTLLSSYQKDRSKLELGLPARGTLLRNPNGDLDKQTLLGHPDWDTFEREVWTLGYAFSHRLDDTWEFRQDARYLQSRVQRNEIWPGALQADDRSVGTTVYDRRNKSITYSLDNQLEGRFARGDWQHTLLFGAAFDRTSFNQDWGAGFGPTLDIYDPRWSARPSAPFTLQNAQLDQQMGGLYSQLQSRYQRWIFLLGGRYDSVDSRFRNKADASSPVSNAAADLDYTDRHFTWQTGLMYAFDNGLSPYVSYSTAFVPTQQISTRSGRPLEPTTAEQYEIGVKYEPLGWNTRVSASLFELTKTDDAIQDASSGEYRNVGESKSKGFELEVESDLSANLSLVAAYTYTDARITEDSEGSLLEGHQITGVPRNQASIWATYRFLEGPLRGLRLGGGVRHFDSTFAYTTQYGTLDSGDVTLLDAMLGYDFDEHWSLTLNAKNLLDKEYVSGCNNAGRCYWGEERSLLGSVAFRW